MMESLTNDIAEKARELIAEVEAAGGMAKAIEAGLPKLRIEEAAAKKQARVDRGEDVIIGVNKYRIDEQDAVDMKLITMRCASRKSHGFIRFALPEMRQGPGEPRRSNDSGRDRGG